MAQSPRDAMPPVPAGKVRLAECGSYDPALNATTTLVDQAVGAMPGFPTVRLLHSTRGYVIAGSCMRWQEARWSVLFDQGGAMNGRSFREEAEEEARALFAKWTDPQEVSRRRQEAAMLEETVYAPGRAARAAEVAARAQAERERKNGLARFRREQRRSRAGALA